MNKLLKIAVLFLIVIAVSGSGGGISETGVTDKGLAVSKRCVNRLRYSSEPIKLAHEMYFDSLMSIDGYDFIIELPTRGAKLYMEPTICDRSLVEVMWRDSSRVLFSDLGPLMFSEWKNREVIPVERSDRKVYVDSFVDTEGVKCFDRCDEPLGSDYPTRIYYLNVREPNRHKMDSLFDRIVFTRRVRIRVGGRVVCDQ